MLAKCETHQWVFQWPCRIDSIQPHATQQRQRRIAIDEQVLKTFHQLLHGEIVTGPGSLVAAQQQPVAGIAGRGVIEDARQFRHIEKPEVGALPGQRMDPVRGIAHQGNPRFDMRSRLHARQRK